jgi:mRNA interferase MazF
MPPLGTTIQQCDIWLVPVPFTDLTSTERRPALVLTTDGYNAQFRDVLVMAITTRLDAAVPGSVFDQSMIEAGILRYQSRLLVSKVFCLDQGILIHRICRAKRSLLDAALAELDKVVGRNR